MARTVKDVRLDNRAARERLDPRKKPYYRVIETGKHIGYYKGLRTGSWLARTFDNGRYAEKKLGTADDTCDANGIDVLSFSQAQGAARAWFDGLAQAGHGAPIAPYTINKACDDYLADYKHRQGKDVRATANKMERLKGIFGEIEVRKLTATQIKDFHRDLGERGGQTSNLKLDENGERRRRAIDPTDMEAKRRRQSSANRLLSTFKAVLNLAYKNQEEMKVSIPSKVAWQSAAPTRGVETSKVRYLQDDEATRLMNACPGKFRDLVAAALLTGARYGELCRFRVRDFDAKAASIFVEVSKSGHSRSIALTNEGVEHFKRLSFGKSSTNHLLIRDDGKPWKHAEQTRPMKLVCVAANIAPAISFHILRHTYGSRLAMKGAPMAVIAKQLGHVDTRITEKHYAHLAPSYVSDVVRALLGTYGVSVGGDTVVAFSQAPQLTSNCLADASRARPVTF